MAVEVTRQGSTIVPPLEKITARSAFCPDEFYLTARQSIGGTHVYVDAYRNGDRPFDMTITKEDALELGTYLIELAGQ